MRCLRGELMKQLPQLSARIPATRSDRGSKLLQLVAIGSSVVSTVLRCPRFLRICAYS